MGKSNVDIDKNNATGDARSAFRIDDNVWLSLRDIPEDQIENTLKRYPENHAELQLLNDFGGSAKVLSGQFSLIRRRYPEVALYLKKLDDKINALAKRQFSECSAIKNLIWHEVNISASGIRLNYDKPLTIGACIELRMQLSKLSNYILAYGEVVRCKISNEDAKYNSIAIEFTHIDVEDREAIHTHVRGKEIKIIREKNLTQEASSTAGR